MEIKNRIDLQFFGEPCAENEVSAATGENAAAAGQEELSLSKEEGDIRAQEAKSHTSETASEQDAAVKKEAAESEPVRLTWEEIMADPEYNRQMQAVVKARLKEAYREQRSEQRDIGEHFKGLQLQAEEMKKTFPSFDLMAELKNPVFARMTSPMGMVSLEDAYFAVHRKELQSAAMRAAANTTAEKIASSIRTLQRRPEENGASSQAPSVTAFNYRNASRQQREAIKKRILERTARGEKVYPGEEM